MSSHLASTPLVAAAVLALLASELRPCHAMVATKWLERSHVANKNLALAASLGDALAANGTNLSDAYAANLSDAAAANLSDAFTANLSDAFAANLSDAFAANSSDALNANGSGVTVADGDGAPAANVTGAGASAGGALANASGTLVAGASPRRRPPYRQVMQNFLGQDLQYFAPVVVGNQTLQGVLDTGSFEILVFSEECKSCGDPRHLYMASKSLTYSSGVYRSEHFFGSGSALSTEGFERISIGPLVAPNISFWKVYDANMPVLAHSSFQTIVGVGPPGTPESNAWEVAVQDKRRLEAWKRVAQHVPSGLRNLTQTQGRVLSKLANESLQSALYVEHKNDSLLEALNVTSFAVCLGKAHGSDGYFVWRDDEVLRHPYMFSHVPVVGVKTWGTKLSGVYLGPPGGSASNSSDVICASGCGAILDSGTSLLVMPRAASKRIISDLEAMGAQCDGQMGVSGLPYMHLVLGGQHFSLPPQAYLGTVVGSMPAHMKGWMRKDHEKVLVCGLQLTVMTQEAESQFGPMWIIGMPFFRQYYVNFHLGDKSNNRSLNVALADNGCRPTDGRGTVLLGARTVDAAGETAPEIPEEDRFRTIDASMLQVPRWAKHAFTAGVVHM